VSIVPVDVMLGYYLAVKQVTINGGSHSFCQWLYPKSGKVVVQIFHIIRHFITDIHSVSQFKFTQFKTFAN